jgi:hypothetical protein
MEAFMADFKIDFNAKRPGKKESTDFFVNSFAAMTAGVPGQTVENIAAQAGYRNHFLYEGELKPLVEKLTEKNKAFDVKGFITMLQKIGAVKEGEAPAFGGGGGALTSINSIERAQEVALEGKAEEVKGYMDQIVELRKKVDALLKPGYGCSVALKNPKKEKEEAPAEESPATA